MLLLPSLPIAKSNSVDTNKIRKLRMRRCFSLLLKPPDLVHIKKVKIKNVEQIFLLGVRICCGMLNMTEKVIKL